MPTENVATLASSHHILKSSSPHRSHTKWRYWRTSLLIPASASAIPLWNNRPHCRNARNPWTWKGI